MGLFNLLIELIGSERNNFVTYMLLQLHLSYIKNRQKFKTTLKSAFGLYLLIISGLNCLTGKLSFATAAIKTLWFEEKTIMRGLGDVYDVHLFFYLINRQRLVFISALQRFSKLYLKIKGTINRILA